MKKTRVNDHRHAAVAISLALCLMALVLPGWRADLHAIDLNSLPNCAQPNSFQLTARIGDAPSTHSLFIGNSSVTGCSIDVPEPFTATIAYLNGGNNWLRVTPSTGTFQQGQRNFLRVTFTPALLPGVGTYQGFVNIRIPSVVGILSIPVNASLAAPSPRLSLSWSSIVFQTVERTGIPPGHPISIFNSGTGTLDWTVNAASIPAWLNITPRSGSLSASNTSGTEITVALNTAALDNGVYSALIPFRSSTARNSPQYLSVTYHVVRPTAGAVPRITNYGMTFTAPVGSTNNLQKSISLSNTGGGSLTTQFTTTTTTGNWVNVLPTSVVATSAAPTTIQVTVNPTGLRAGTYRGTITASFPGRSPQTVDVALIITELDPTGYEPQPPCNPNSTYCLRGSSVTDEQTGGASLAGCTPIRMSLIGSTVGNGSNSPVSFPQALLAQLVDSCGDPVTNGTVVATAGGVSIPMSNAGGGFYNGTWTPQQAAATVNITFAGFHPNFSSVQQIFAVSSITASGGTVLPVLFNDGVVEGAGFAQRRPLVPGGIVSLFGSALAPTTAAASTIPLETELSQTSVLIGGVPAPLYFVSEGQINAQVPFESRPGDTVSIVVNAGGRLTTPQNYQIAAAQPGIFVDSNGAAVLDNQFRRVTVANPARLGRIIQIFAGGLGDTIPPVGSGDALQTGSDITVPVSVSIGGIDAQVLYDGLAPTFVGLYQINVLVPREIQTGNAVPLLLRQNGVPSNPTQNITIPVAP